MYILQLDEFSLRDIRVCSHHPDPDKEHFQLLSFSLVLSLFAMPQGLVWNLNSLNRNRTLALVVKVQGPNHWTTRDFPPSHFFFFQ